MLRLFRILQVAALSALLLSIGGCAVPGRPHKSSPAPAESTTTPGANRDRTSQPNSGSTRGPSPSPAPEPAGPGPRIKFRSAVCDFGEIWQGENADCRFKFTNTGDAVLRIADLKAACGCTVAEIDKKTFAPGETGEIKATFRSAGYRGKIDKHITVTCDDPRQPKSSLTISGRVIVPVDVQPRLIVISHGRPDTIETKQVKIVPIDPEGFRVLGVEGAPGWVHCSEPKRATEQPGVWFVTITVGPDLPLGRLNTPLTISTNDKRQPSVTLRIVGNVSEDSADTKASTSPTR